MTCPAWLSRSTGRSANLEKRTSCFISKPAPPPIPANLSQLASFRGRRPPPPHAPVKKKWPRDANPPRPYGKHYTGILRRHAHALAPPSPSQTVATPSLSPLLPLP